MKHVKHAVITQWWNINIVYDSNINKKKDEIYYSNDHNDDDSNEDNENDNEYGNEIDD